MVAERWLVDWNEGFDREVGEAAANRELAQFYSIGLFNCTLPD